MSAPDNTEAEALIEQARTTIAAAMKTHAEIVESDGGECEMMLEIRECCEAAYALAQALAAQMAENERLADQLRVKEIALAEAFDRIERAERRVAGAMAALERIAGFNEAEHAASVARATLAAEQEDGWRPIEMAPEGVWLRTRRAGEDGENLTLCRRSPDGDVEWIDRQGRTTVTHHSFAAPTHWTPLGISPRRLVMALREHWLTGILCDHDAKTDVATCYCAKWRSEPQPNVGDAVERWIEHLIASLPPSPKDTP